MHIQNNPEPTLVLFCRRPAPGIGKRRLAEAIGDGAAAAIAAALLDAALEDAAAWPGPLVIAPAGAGDAGWAGSLLQRQADVLVQPPGSLGQRIAAVDAALRCSGRQAIAFIGSDAPSLQGTDYAQARRALARGDVVLGPAEDGGITLMASACGWPAGLAELPWETPQLGQVLHSACTAAGLRVHELAMRFDVDRAGDLDRLRDQLPADARPARQRLLACVNALVPASGCGQRALP